MRCTCEKAARAQALEDAADVAEAMGDDTIASYIRLLKREPTERLAAAVKEFRAIAANNQRASRNPWSNT